MSTNNPFDEKNIRSHDFRICRAYVEPKHDDDTKKTLNLKVPDGPEVFEHFDLNDPLDVDGENELTRAITAAANNLIECAQTDEAGHWIQDHETVYVVMGISCLQKWGVKAFLSRERADDLLGTLNQWCCKHRVHTSTGSQITIFEPAGAVVKCPHDPKFRVDKNGVRYEIEEIPIDMFDPIRE